MDPVVARYTALYDEILCNKFGCRPSLPLNLIRRHLSPVLVSASTRLFLR